MEVWTAALAALLPSGLPLELKQLVARPPVVPRPHDLLRRPTDDGILTALRHLQERLTLVSREDRGQATQGCRANP